MVDVRGLDPRFAPSSRLSSMRFLTYSAQEVEKISCKRITNPITLDSLFHPNMGGLYDPALGPSNKQDLCGTCQMNYTHCPGHLGHITLPLPVYHPVFFMHMFTLLQASCWNCHRFLCSTFGAHIFTGQLELIEHGLLMEADGLEGSLRLEDAADSADKFEDFPDELLENIQNYVERSKREAAEKFGSLNKVKTKNVIESRKVKIAEFLYACTKKVKKCLYCSAPARSIRHEGRTRIFHRGLTVKSAETWRIAHSRELKRKKMAKEMARREGSDEEQDGGECDEVEQDGRDVHEDASEVAMKLTKQNYLSPLEVREHLHELWVNQRTIIRALVGCSGYTREGWLDERSPLTVRSGHSQDIGPHDIFFLEIIPVPPSRFRPIGQLGEQRYENPQSSNLQRLLVDTIDIQAILLEKKAAEEKELQGDKSVEGEEEIGKKKRERRKQQSFTERLQLAWLKLQTDVNLLMDSSSDKNMRAPSGIQQILEKKEGLFRKHMMGKRVDFSARSVISPDPYINVDEIGIPLVFATKLTFPQPVTHWNVEELRQAVINGPAIHPGATHVQYEDGSVVLLSSHLQQRVAIAKKLLTPSKEGEMGGASKKVFRHLKNGDILLVNRQPTLHKPSIMAHKARVLAKEKTLRLHYGNCKSYNADFDGDEMNAHFPQNELARAEGYHIVSTHHQYLVPKDGTPLSGLIQDHVVSGVLMTLRGRMFTRMDYMHLLFCSLPNHEKAFRLLLPCIHKPSRLWSGKQIISTLLLNIVPNGRQRLNLTSSAKISVSEWGRGSSGILRKRRRKKLAKKMHYSEDSMTESEVIFCQGELVCGVLDKSQFGASQYGLVHCCYELYGGCVASLLLSALGRLFTSFLQLHGFTLGVEDILVLPEADEERGKVMLECSSCGPEAAAKALGLDDPGDRDLLRMKFEEAHRSSDPSALKTLDFFMKERTDHFNNSVNKACVPAGLHKPFPSNSLQLMVQSGAKGSTVNCMQISCLLGQIELEGQRPPMMLSGRFLPSFLPYDPSPRAGGFVDGRFLTGIRPQEYFFHCMAGREGLVDTAVKTSRSGYLQRCLIKHLEGLCVGYDLTVRDSDGSVVQFLYGEDGMDICKTTFLNEKQFPFIVDNYQTICDQLDPQSAIPLVDSKKAVKYQRKVDRWKRYSGDCSYHPRKYVSGFLHFCEKHIAEVEFKYAGHKRKHKKKKYRTKAQLELMNLWYGMSPMSRTKIWNKFSHDPVPVNARLNPDRHFGAVSTEIYERIHSFVDKNPKVFKQDRGAGEVSAEKFESLVNFKCLRALADPGESVGLLAAQSIGEPSTQMTLNTFHFAGTGEMNVTLGIPRLREILMTASHTIRTPSMEVPLLRGPQAKQRGEQLKRTFTKVYLNEVLEKAEVWETLARVKKGHRHRHYDVKLTFLPHQYYKDDYELTPEAILRYVENSFLKKLVNSVNNEIKMIRKKRSEAVMVQKDTESPQAEEEPSKEPGPVDEDDESELSDVEKEITDASSAKLLSKKQQHASYDGPGESDEEAVGECYMSASLLEETDEEEQRGRKGTGETVEEEEEEDVMESVNCGQSTTTSSHSPSLEDTIMDKNRVRDVLSRSPALVSYSYDSSAGEWCYFSLKFSSLDGKVMLSSVIDRLAAKSVVCETAHINKGFLVEEDGQLGEEGEPSWHLKTDGVNLQELWNHSDTLDLTKAYTNDIHAMAETYGIEAAYKAIIREIRDVFKVYGIHVDHRHLSLIADYMTFEGSYKPFNRIGIESNSSPLQKMSFETTMHFLQSATLAGESDPLLSPSACLVTGKVVRAGTGSFELLQKLC